MLKPLSPARYKLQLTLRQETHERLLRARDLLRHAVPGGELEEVLDRALITLLKDLERVRCGAADRPRETAANTRPKDGRTIPAAVRRAVWARDGGQCAFVGAERRCGETGFLELHHVVPFADGGAASIENIQLRCRAHNANPPCLPVSATPWSDSFVCCRSGRGKRGDGRRRARHGLGPAALRAGQRADSTMRIRAVLRSETRAMRTRASGRAPGSSFRSP